MAIIKMLQQVRVTTFEQKHRKSQQRKIQGRAKWNFRSKKQKHTHTHILLVVSLENPHTKQKAKKKDKLIILGRK